MGRKGSELIPFFKSALCSGKYSNLKFKGDSLNVFTLNFPQKSSRLDTDCQQILKDWYNLKGRSYRFFNNYTKAKQAMESSVRRSDFLELMKSGRNQMLICRFLETEEIKAKKLLKKVPKKKLDENSNEATDYTPPLVDSSKFGTGRDSPVTTDYVPPSIESPGYFSAGDSSVITDYGLRSVESSGYGSEGDTPAHWNIDESHIDHAITHAVKHDTNIHALLYALQHDHEYLIPVEDATPEPSELNYLEGVRYAERMSLVENVDLHNGNVMPVGQLEEDDFENPNASLDFVGSNMVPDQSDVVKENFHGMGSSHQGSCINGLNQLFTINKFLIPCSNDSEGGELKNLNDIADLKKYLTGKDVSLTIDTHENLVHAESITNDSEQMELPTSFKLKKVYDCLHRLDLPGTVILACQPKLMEFCEYDSYQDEPNSSRFIFDEATTQVMASCTLHEIKVLQHDHLLLILNRKT